MAYTAPDKAALRTGLARDLRDPDLNTFTSAELDDLLNLAIVEVSRVYPKGEVQELPVTEDKERIFDTDAMSLFRVELIKDEAVYYSVVVNSHDSSGEGGYDLHGGKLYLPLFAANYISVDDSPSVRIWGYWPRENLVDDTDILDGDAETEWGVRTVAALNGYQRLQNDRLLFAQWLTNTGNTDVSPNQLSQTADLYQRQWETQRNRLRSLQRV